MINNQKIKLVSKETVILINRGPAVLASDEEIIIRKAPQPARLLLP